MVKLSKSKLNLHCPDYFKRLWKLFSLNFWTLLKFELIFKAATLVLFSPLVVAMIRIAMKVSGYRYITLDNLFGFAVHPITILLAVICLVVFTFLTVFDIGAVLVIFDESYHEDRLSLFSLIKHNFIQCSKLFRPKNIGVAFYTLFLAPFLNIGFGSNILSSFRLPEFISDYISSNKFLISVFVVLYLFLLFVFTNWLFVMHYMVLERKSFKQARIASYRLIKNNRLGDLLRILLAEFLFLGVLKLIVFIGAFAVKAIVPLLSGKALLSSISVSFLGVILSLLSLTYITFSNVLNYAVMSSLFYRHKEQSGEEISEVVLGPEMKKKEMRHFGYWSAGFLTLLFVGLTAWLYLSQTGQNQINVESLRGLEITAHRGASKDYPENTMSAFKGAVDAGADWIELDVQQTKDGMVVVSHDASLKRTAGIKRNIYDMDYAELEMVDVGRKSMGFEHIPTLAEVLIFANENNIKLNIELKPNGHEIELEQDVLYLINTYYRKDMCIISSLNYDSLKRVKELDPGMTTLYTLALASGNIEDFEYADAFSVEASSITSRLVRRVHNAGKEIFAWTVNSEDSIYDMIELGVDNIISDEVVMARGLVLKYRSGNSIDRFVRIITELSEA